MTLKPEQKACVNSIYEEKDVHTTWCISRVHIYVYMIVHVGEHQI